MSSLKVQLTQAAAPSPPSISFVERYKVAVEARINLKHVHRRLQAPRLLPPLGHRSSEFTASVSVRWLPSF